MSDYTTFGDLKIWEWFMFDGLRYQKNNRGNANSETDSSEFHFNLGARVYIG